MATKKIMNEQNAYTALKWLAAFGVFLAIYLLGEQAIARPVGICNINATVNCEAIVSGDVSKLLGIPTPIYGLIGYVVIFFAAIRAKRRLLLGTAAAGLAFCMGIAYVELAVLHVICPICVLCQLTMIAVFSLAVSLNRDFFRKQDAGKIE